MAGFTTVRDLGTEGARLRRRRAEAGGQSGHHPRSARAGLDPRHRRHRQLSAEGFALEWRVPQGAEEADGVDSLTRVVRDQIGHGADWIKLYGDYRWGPLPGAHPTFSLDEMKLAVETAKSAGVPVAVHTSTPEGMRRAVLAGAETIEHGDDGTPEIFKLMAEHHVALCPTLAAGDATRWRQAAARTRRRSSARKARQLQGGARSRRDHPQRQRRRRLRARRQRARNRNDGGLRHDAGCGA